MKRLLAIVLVAAMLFGLIPGNAIVFAEDGEMLLESRLGSEMGMLADRDISEEEWTVELSDGTVIPNAKISSTQNVPIPLIGYTVEFTQADLDKLVGPSKRVKVSDDGHSIEVTMGKGQSFRKLDIGKSNKKDGVYTISFESLPLVKGSSIQKGVIVIKSEIVERTAVAWKLETTEGKPLEGTVKLDGDYYFVQVTRESLEKAVKKGETFLGINPSGGAVYSTKTDDGTSTESQKISDYTYHTATTSFFEYQFDKSKVSSSVLEGKIVFDLIAPNTEMFPKWTIKTKSGLDVPVDRQTFIDLAKENDEPSLQNWAYYVYVNKNALKEELARQGHEFISLDINKTTVKLHGTQYQFDGTASEYFLDSNNFLDVDTLNEYSFAIQVNDTGKLIELKSAELYIDVTTKSTKHKVTFDPNNGTLEGKKEVEVKDGKTVERPKDPVKKGYKFLYWAVGSEDGEEFKFDTPIKADLKLVAKYEIGEFTVTFDPGEGKMRSTSVEVEPGKRIPANVIFKPTWRGHLFTGWTVDGESFDPDNDVVNKDTHAVAQYTDLPVKNGAGFVVQLKVDGKLIPLDGIFVTSKGIKHDGVKHVDVATFESNIDEARIVAAINDDVELVKIKDVEVVAMGHFSHKGHFLNAGYMIMPELKIFKKEYVSVVRNINGKSATPVIKVQMQKDFGQVEGGTITVELEVKQKHTVTLDLNGGTFAGQTVFKLADGEVFKQPSVKPYIAGHRFLGWYLGDTLYDFSSKVTSDITLVAKYIKVEDQEDQGFKVYIITPDGRRIAFDPTVVTKIQTKPDGDNTEHRYEVASKLEEIKAAVDVKWDVIGIKEYVVKAKRRAELIEWDAPSTMISISDDKLTYRFYVSIPKNQDVIGGEIEIFVDAIDTTIPKHTVTFDLKGGLLEGSSDNRVVKVLENTAVANPGTPAKAGHTFKHWAVGSEAGAAYDFATPVTTDLTLVAVYEVVNTGGNTGGTGSDQGSGSDFFPGTNTGSTTGTVEIEEEEAPLSKVLSDDVLINGEKTALEIGKDGTIVVTEEDLKDVKHPILMSFKMTKGNNAFVTFQKSKEKEDIIPVSMFFDGRMHVVIAGPGTYAAKDATVAFRGISEKHWATSFVQVVGARQLMVGNENGDFMPEMLTSRAMFTQILARLQFVDLTNVKSGNYVDVPSDKWYSASVNWATERGIVNGVGEGKFAPEDAITREQLAVMIYNYMKLNGWDLKAKAGAAQFNDYDQVSEWAKEAVTVLKDFGIFEGKPGYMFDPKANVTRAEVATVVARLLEMYLKALNMK